MTTAPDPTPGTAAARTRGTSGLRRAARVGSGALLVGAGPAAVLLAAGPAGAATVTVSNLDDSGAGSLRDALATASDGDTVEFAAGLTGTITLTSGQLEIDGESIVGPGSSLLSIDGNDSSRVFYVADGGVFSITGVTITGGIAGDGGGIYCDGEDASMTLDDVVVTGNTAEGSGGGINWYRCGDLDIDDSVISGNFAADSGGGILVEHGANGYDTVITGSTISDNTALYGGGGIYFYFSGSLTIEDTTISGNESSNDDGGGVYFYGAALTIADSTISGNSASDDGGGVYAGSITAGVSITNTTVSDNQAGFYGGGMTLYLDSSGGSVTGTTITGNSATEGAGGLFISHPTSEPFTISDSTVAGNTTPGVGGGIQVYGGDADTLVTIDSTTVSGNVATGNGGGLYLGSSLSAIVNSTFSGNTGSAGGGLFVEAPVDIDFTTITDNTATAGSGIFLGDALVGSPTVDASIVSGNAPSGSDIDGVAGRTITTGRSVLGTRANVTVTDGGGNVDATDPGLGALAANGGPTATHFPLAGSPALGIGPSSTGVAYDQRGPGFPRVADGASDAGSVERPAPTVPAPPTDPTAVAGDGRATITWVAPLDDGGSPVTGYRVTAGPGGATCTTTGALTCEITGLTNGVAYTFTVVAINEVGESGPSVASAAVTPTAPLVTTTTTTATPTTEAPAADPVTATGDLPYTGSDVLPLALAGGAIAAVGAVGAGGALLARRRRTV